MSRHENGNALVEYSLMGLLYAFCGVGLFVLGINLLHLLENSSQQTASANNTYMSQILGPPVAAATMKNPSFSPPSSNSPLSTVMPLPSANAQPIPQQPLLSGANGMTEQLASTLRNNASNLLAAGEITLPQANLLIALADQGHILAQNQALFENALMSGQKNIVYMGQKYSLSDFSDLLGFKGKTTSQQNWQLDPSLTSSLLQPFAAAYQAVQQSGMLNNPKVQQQVSGVAIQIGSLADALGWSANEVLAQNNTASPAATYSAYQSALVANFQTNLEDSIISSPISSFKTASSVTTTNSITICNAGSGQDTGTTCTP